MPAKILDKATFDSKVLTDKGTTLIDFFATWCGPCRMVSPTVDAIAEERGDISVYKVDVDEQPELAQQFGIMSVPTLAVIKDGKLIRQESGAKTKDGIIKMLGD